MLDWVRAWIGMPAGASGLLTNGGSGANLTAVVAARHEAVGDDATRIARLTLYTSDQSHSSVARAAWMAGVPRANVRLLPCDGDFRLRVGDLERAIADDRAKGMIPLMVAANAGTTNTGAVDPLHAIADLCAREKIWMHVDAAYGGFAVLAPRGREALAGLERADSVTLDPHKWLYVPFECGCLIARDPNRLKAAFHILPEYLKDTETSGGEVNFADYGEQLSRMARGIKVWLNVHYYGTDALAAAIEYSLGLAPVAEREVRATRDLEVLAPATLGILCFRAAPAGVPAVPARRAERAHPPARERLREILHLVHADPRGVLTAHLPDRASDAGIGYGRAHRDGGRVREGLERGTREAGRAAGCVNCALVELVQSRGDPVPASRACASRFPLPAS